MLDLGCGMGNLSRAAARCGARVTAVDASGAAIGNLAVLARGEGLAIDARIADLRAWTPQREWDAVACIGLLMFFAPLQARGALARLRSAVRAGGVAVVNVLVEGTTYLEMFDPDSHCLFTPGEVAAAFEGWSILERCAHVFPAPGGTAKRFETVVARRPG